LVVTLVTGCAPAVVPPAAPADAAPGRGWRAEREAVVAQVNVARHAAGLPRLAYDAALERVGDAHCEILVAEDGRGHFSRSGVPPYLRYLLAGGHGFHRENVAMFSSSAPVAASAVGAILARAVVSMLDELPPNDGHRRALLDRDVTNIGVGLAIRGGEVRMAQELATEATVAWVPPPTVALPRTRTVLTGRLEPPWRPVEAEVLWEALPHPLSDAELRAIHSYGYPPRRIVFDANRPPGERGLPHAATAAGPATETPFTVDKFGNFSFQWTTGPSEGVEIVVIGATNGRGRELVPVAVSATVVTETGTLPAELAFWRHLAGGPSPARGDAP